MKSIKKDMELKNRVRQRLVKDWLRLSGALASYEDRLLTTVEAVLREVDDEVFEQQVLPLALCALGYRDIDTTRRCRDGGIDAVCRDGEGRKVVAQAKRYAGAVSCEKVRALVGVMPRLAAQGAVFVTSGRFGPQNWQEHEGLVRLIDGRTLATLLLRAGAVPGVVAEHKEIFPAEAQ